MPKKKVEKPERELTKRQMSHWQRESKLQRFTLLGGIILILVVIVLVGTGVFVGKYAPMRETVIKAGDTEYSMSYYIDALNYYGQQDYSYYSQFGMDYKTFLSYTTSSVAQQIEANQFLKETAAAGIGTPPTPVTVSDDEVNKYIQDNKLDSNQAVWDAVYAQLLQTKLTDYFDKQLPATNQQRAVLAMFLESRQQAEQVKARLANGENFGDIAGSLSTESISKGKNGDFGWVAQGVLPSTLSNKSDPTLDNAVFDQNLAINTVSIVEDTAQTKYIGYWLVEVIPGNATPTPSATPESTPTATASPSGTTTPTPTSTTKHVMLMLLGSLDQAQQIKAQLANGADFATLAKANSQYNNAATNGGDQGDVAKGTLPSAVDKIVFPDDASQAISENTVSDPIADTFQTTTGGYWLYEVTGIEERTLDGTNRSTLAQNESEAWQNKVWSDNSSKVTNSLTSDKITYAIDQAAARAQ